MSDEEIIEITDTLKANDKTMKDSGISDNLWGKAVECITFLQFENAHLHEKFVALNKMPCNIGDTVYVLLGLAIGVKIMKETIVRVRRGARIKYLK